MVCKIEGSNEENGEMNNDLQYEDTYDLQHDLAMFIADDDFGELNIAFRNELIRRGADLPENCRWEYSPYYSSKKKLVYDLSSAGAHRL